MKKFDNRIELFKEILIEVYNHELNYKEEINNLNIKLQNIISQHSNKFLSEVASNSRSKYSDENPFIDKLISDEVQQLLAYFLNKYSIISKGVEEMRQNIIGNMTQKTKSDYLELLTKEQKKFETNLNLLKIAKRKYDLKMSKLETQIYNIALQKRNIEEKGNFQEILDKKGNICVPISFIEEVINAKENYMLAIDTINLNKRDYFNKASILNTEINLYNNKENSILSQVFQIFKKNLENLMNNLKDFSFLNEQNKKSNVKDTVSFDLKINKAYNFEEYIPQHKDLSQKIDLEVLIELNKNIGFKIEDSFSDKKNKKEIKFLLLMEKVKQDCESLRKSEIDSIKEILNEKEYIIKFIQELNNNRVRNDMFNNKISFDIIYDFFNYILTKLNLVDDHQILKNLLILSQTYYLEDKNKKIYIYSKMNQFSKFKDKDFWIGYLDKEIIINQNTNLNDENEEAFISFISNLPILNDFLSDHSKISSIVKLYKEKYLFTQEKLNTISEQLGFKIEI